MCGIVGYVGPQNPVQDVVLKPALARERNDEGGHADGHADDGYY